MKKLFALILAVLLSLGLAVPALAFTGDTADDVDHPYDLKIYLVEYDDNDLFGLACLPPTDRGYAKNEIVAAVVELFVPEDETITIEEYPYLVLGGENVDLNVAENYVSGDISLTTTDNLIEAPALDFNVSTQTNLNNDDEIDISIIELDGDATYRWLFFAKVTGDQASLYAKLLEIDHETEFDKHGLDVVLDGDRFTVEKSFDEGDEGYYQIEDEDGNYIRLYVDEDHKTTGMSIDPADATDLDEFISLGVNTKNELGIVDGAKTLTSGDDFETVMDVYEDVVADAFGLDYFLIGNYLRDSFFINIVSPGTIIATVDIAPFTAYVTVPDNIVVDPPKTGDAASLIGFVMVALSCAGTAMLKKRG